MWRWSAHRQGDDTVVELARQRPGATIVTADRGLRARIEGTAVLGPRELLARLGPEQQP